MKRNIYLLLVKWLKYTTIYISPLNPHDEYSSISLTSFFITNRIIIDVCTKKEITSICRNKIYIKSYPKWCKFKILKKNDDLGMLSQLLN